MLIEFFLELGMVLFILCTALFSSVLQALFFCFAYLSWHLINAWRLWSWLQHSHSHHHAALAPFSTLGIWQILVNRFYQMHIQLRADAEQLKQLECMRRDFVANISHELRTPLTVLHGYLETLADNAESVNTLPLTNIYQQMQQQTLHMEDLVHDLLLLSRLEHHPAQHVEPIPLAELFEQITNKIITVLQASRHTINADIPKSAQILGERDALFSAFSNLILNAIHYSPAGSIVAIHVSTHDDHVHVRFTDHGIGIAAHDIARLTERFYRAANAKHYRHDGTGLGLAIVKHVLLRHHATLNIQSTLGEGSCFECVFPARNHA